MGLPPPQKWVQHWGKRVGGAIGSAPMLLVSQVLPLRRMLPGSPGLLGGPIYPAKEMLLERLMLPARQVKPNNPMLPARRMLLGSPMRPGRRVLLGS